MIAELAALLVRPAVVRCPGIPRPLDVVLEREPRWARGERAHFDTRDPFTIHLDPRERRVELVVAHECEHHRRFLERPLDVAYWSMGEPVRRPS